MSQTPKRRSGGRKAAGASGGKNSEQRRHDAPDAGGAARAAAPQDDAAQDDAAAVDEVTDADTAGAVDTADEAAAGAGGPVPVRLLVAAAVAGLEGVAVAAWGVATCFSGGGNAVLAGLFVLLLAAVPLAASYGLRHARRWSRGPAMVMQLLALPVAWTMLKGDGPFVAAGAVLGALAVTGLALLAHPATTDALGIRRAA